MKQNKFNLLIIVLTSFILYLVISKKLIVQSTIIYSLNIWVNTLVPSLFPFFVISDILINYDITSYIPNFVKKIFRKLFNITDNMLTILLLSVISGFPSNARNTRTMYDNKLITLEEANHILMFSHFSNPLFITTTVSVFFFHDKSIGPMLLLIHYLSNFFVGLIFRNEFKHESTNHERFDVKKNFGTVLINSIKKSVDTILLICGIVAIFLLLSTLITNLFSLNNYNSMLVKGLMEITIGLESLSKLNLSYEFKMILTSIILSFGGLSVHMQVYSQISDSNISYHHFFLGRIIASILAGILTKIYFLI